MRQTSPGGSTPVVCCGTTVTPRRSWSAMRPRPWSIVAATAPSASVAVIRPISVPSAASTMTDGPTHCTTISGAAARRAALAADWSSAGSVAAGGSAGVPPRGQPPKRSAAIGSTLSIDDTAMGHSRLPVRGPAGSTANWRTVPSVPTPTTVPSRAAATSHSLPTWPGIRRTSAPVVASKICTALSPQPVTTRLPSAMNAHPCTRAPCCGRVTTWFPVATSQMRGT